MKDFIDNITSAFLAQSYLEVVAVVCAVLYLVLVVKENIWCWFFAFISTAIYIYLFHSVSLLSESILNVYYLIMSVYGWMQWRKTSVSLARKIQCWKSLTHIKILIVTVLVTPVVGYFMERMGASFPYIDAFVAILAVVATLMVVYKVFENWYYWLLADVISIYLFWQKQMYLTALLFVIYVALIFVGIKSWKEIMHKEQRDKVL